jgi:hypothetical protein
MKQSMMILLGIVIFSSVCFSNPLPWTEITALSAEPPQITVRISLGDIPENSDSIIIMAGDTIFTAGGPAIINSDDILSQPLYTGQIITFDSSNTSGLVINPEADTINFSTWVDGFGPLIMEPARLGNLGHNPKILEGQNLHIAYYYYYHQWGHYKVLSFDFCEPDMGFTDVIINEINVHGTWNGGSGFIELYNKSVEDISLAGWKMVCDTIYDFPSDAIIQAHGFYVVDQADYPANFGVDINADNLYLISAQDDPQFAPGTLRRVDQVGWSSDHGENVSFMRYPDGDCRQHSNYEDLNWDFMGYNDQSSARTFENGFPSRGAANRHESPGFTVIGTRALVNDSGEGEIFWSNPIWAEGFQRSILVKSLTGYPETPADGTVLYEGTGQHYVDPDIPYDTPIYYTVFAVSDLVPEAEATDESRVRLLRATVREYLAGDANMINGQWPAQIIGGDVTYLVGYFRGLNQACNIAGFYCAADVNGDCQVIGSDVTRLVSYFRGTGVISYCPNFPPLWLNPDDLPETMPDGWPNCEE